MTKNIQEEKQPKQSEQTQQAQQERMMRLSMLEQEAKQLQQQLQLIEQQVVELQILKLSLDELEKSKPKDEMLSSIGRNIFLKTALLSKELLVDVGAKTVVKKSIPDTKKIIDNDVDKLTQARDKLMAHFNQINQQLHS